MSLQLQNRQVFTSLTQGTNDFALINNQGLYPVEGDLSVYYEIFATDGDWEKGNGTYNAEAGTLDRTDVLTSSNSNALVDFEVGYKDVILTLVTQEPVTNDLAFTTVVDEVPTGTINGTNAVFHLANTAQKLKLYVNGVRQVPTVDYTISGSTITFIGEVPIPTDRLRADYELGNSESVRTVLKAIISDFKATGIDGGSFIAGNWRTRELNTVVDPDDFVTLTDNQVTLGPGRYLFQFFAVSYNAGTTQTRIYNVTDDVATSVLGATAPNNQVSQGSGIITISSGTKTFELQHRCSITSPINGMGLAANFNQSELYCQLIITLQG